MAVEGYTTLGQTTLASGYTAGSGTMALTSGSSFPAAGLTFSIRANGSAIYTCTRSSNTLTVTLEAGSDSNLSSGAEIIEVVTQRSLDAMRVDQCGTGTDVALPAAQKAGRLYLPTDSHVIYRDTGSVQERWQMQHVDFQALSGLTWLNQTVTAVSGTADDSTGVLKMFCPAQAGPNLRVLKKAVTLVSGGFAFEVQLYPLLLGVQFSRAGILLRESATGKMLLMACGASVIDRIWIERWTDFNAGGLAQLVNVDVWPGNGIWLKMQMDATNIKCFVGTWGSKGNAGYWIELLSEAKTASFTTAPDELGICIDPNNAAYGCGVHVGTWKEF